MEPTILSRELLDSNLPWDKENTNKASSVHVRRLGRLHDTVCTTCAVDTHISSFRIQQNSVPCQSQEANTDMKFTIEIELDSAQIICLIYMYIIQKARVSRGYNRGLH